MPITNLLNLADIYREADRSKAAQMQFEQQERALANEASLANIFSRPMSKDPVESYRAASVEAARRGMGQEAMKLKNYADNLEISRAKVSQKGKGYYGGVQTGIDAKTQSIVPWTIDEATGTPYRLDTMQPAQLGKDILPTVTMQPQQIVGPGGVNQIVQIPGKGVPGMTPMVTNTGMMPDKNFTAETAGKLKMLDQAAADVQDVRGTIFDDKGSLKKGVLFGASVPFTAGVGGDSRKVYSAIENAVAAKLRAETGAAANIEEVKKTAKRFAPTILDTPESAKYKLDRLEEFVNSTYGVVDPSGVYPRINRQNQQNKPTSPAPTSTQRTWEDSQYLYRQLPDGTVQRKKK